MRRLAIALLVLGFAGLPVETASAGSRTATVKLVECRISEGAHGRVATFLGRMRAVPGTEQMSMRFTLLEQLGRRAPVALDVPALGSSRISKPGVRTFSYRQRVRGLLPGGSYRVVVDFQWLDDEGEPLRSTVRRSARCRQRGKPPNLRLEAIEALPGPVPGSAVYAVAVANTGASELRGLRLKLAVDGLPLELLRIGSLEPGDRRVIKLVAPVCLREVEATLDPQQGVRESNEADNVRVLSCRPLGL